MGVYDASVGYPFLNLRYLIDLDLQMIINKLPDSLISALQNKDITVESLTRI